VPQTAEGGEPFAAWQECARRLADDLDATLVDDRGTVITLHAFATIGQELGRLYRPWSSRPGCRHGCGAAPVQLSSTGPCHADE
jgi:hypothetical protein